MESIFSITVIEEKKDEFIAAIKKRNKKGGTVVGGMGKDKKGLYINISDLTLEETEELIKHINSMNESYKDLKVSINCD